METQSKPSNQPTGHAVTLRIVAVAVLIFVLLIPTSMVKSLVQERMNRRDQAVAELNASWAHSQKFRAPVLSIPYRSVSKLKDGTEQTAMRVAHFTPSILEISGHVEPEVRQRGIFKSVIYTTTLTVRGEFATPSFDSFHSSGVNWEDANISVGISDLRGIKDSLVIDWAGAKHSFSPGIKYPATDDIGASVNVPVGGPRATYPFTMTVQLKGSESLSFIPLGKKCTVKLNSPWQHPSFIGSFLPDERRVDASGFEATWNTLFFNRSIPESWADTWSNLDSASFGVNLIFPVDHYSNVTRSIKYASLFIFLTFLVFFFIEFFRQKRMHPIQYLLVGGALTLFYLLLLSLSEHISFLAAYMIATTGVIGLIGGYTHAVFERARVTTGVIALLVGLYSFLYTLLQMEDYALLMGSLGLFLVLGIIMYATRKIDWYSA